MLYSSFRRHALALVACLVAAGSAGMTHALAQVACPCTLAKHSGDACLNGASSMSVRSSAVYNQSGIEYYLIDVFGSWYQIDCGGTQNGADGCTATVYGLATYDSDGSLVGDYLGSDIAGLCGSTCTEVGLPASNPANPPHSYWEFTSLPGQSFTTVLYLCDGCTVGQNCNSTNRIVTQSKQFTPGS